MNLYAYTWNDPANWTDPSGLSPTASFVRLTAKAAELYMGPFGHVAEGTLCLANKISTALQDIGNRLEEGRDISEVELHAVGCIVRAVAPLPCRCQGSGGRGGPRGKNSFPEGTEVLTPQGKVAIEDLREGDLVIARDEETGASGTFPITGVSARQANDLLWLHLERVDGATSRMGVTTGHPMFTVGQGWLTAGELAAGDRIRNANLHDLTVLSVEPDQTPQRVHNLEIAEAHTYFVGDLEAWGHNGWNTRSTRKSVYLDCGGKCTSCGIAMVFKGPRTGTRRDRFSVGHRLSRKDFPHLADEDWNLNGQCCSCNSKQGTKFDWFD